MAIIENRLAARSKKTALLSSVEFLGGRFAIFRGWVCQQFRVNWGFPCFYGKPRRRSKWAIAGKKWQIPYCHWQRGGGNTHQNPYPPEKAFREKGGRAGFLSSRCWGRFWREGSGGQWASCPGFPCRNKLPLKILHWVSPPRGGNLTAMKKDTPESWRAGPKTLGNLPIQLAGSEISE